MASKLEAVAGRGGRDLRFSTDFEDIVFVLDNAPDVLAQVRSESTAVLTYLQQTFRQLLSRPDLEEGIYAHLPPRFATARLDGIMNLLKQLIS